MIAAAPKPTLASWLQLIERRDLFDHWLSARPKDAVVGIHTFSGQSPIERWLSDNNFAVRVYLDWSRSLAIQCPTPAWIRHMMLELKQTGKDRHPIYAWEVHKARLAFESGLQAVGGEK